MMCLVVCLVLIFSSVFSLALGCPQCWLLAQVLFAGLHGDTSVSLLAQVVKALFAKQCVSFPGLTNSLFVFFMGCVNLEDCFLYLCLIVNVISGISAYRTAEPQLCLHIHLCSFFQAIPENPRFIFLFIQNASKTLLQRPL